jgi:hypothetical protein
MTFCYAHGNKQKKMTAAAPEHSPIKRAAGAAIYLDELPIRLHGKQVSRALFVQIAGGYPKDIAIEATYIGGQAVVIHATARAHRPPPLGFFGDGHEEDNLVHIYE